jgi:hypothetical protein
MSNPIVHLADLQTQHGDRMAEPVSNFPGRGNLACVNDVAAAGASKDVLAAGLATFYIMFVNESGANTMRLQVDGSAATATNGIPIPPGMAWEFPVLPTAKLTLFCAAADPYTILYA